MRFGKPTVTASAHPGRQWDGWTSGDILGEVDRTIVEVDKALGTPKYDTEQKPIKVGYVTYDSKAQRTVFVTSSPLTGPAEDSSRSEAARRRVVRPPRRGG